MAQLSYISPNEILTAEKMNAMLRDPNSLLYKEWCFAVLQALDEKDAEIHYLITRAEIKRYQEQYQADYHAYKEKCLKEFAVVKTLQKVVEAKDPEAALVNALNQFSHNFAHLKKVQNDLLIIEAKLHSLEEKKTSLEAKKQTTETNIKKLETKLHTGETLYQSYVENFKEENAAAREAYVKENKEKHSPAILNAISESTPKPPKPKGFAKYHDRRTKKNPDIKTINKSVTFYSLIQAMIFIGQLQQNIQEYLPESAKAPTIEELTSIAKAVYKPNHNLFIQDYENRETKNEMRHCKKSLEDIDNDLGMCTKEIINEKEVWICTTQAIQDADQNVKKALNTLAGAVGKMTHVEKQKDVIRMLQEKGIDIHFQPEEPQNKSKLKP